MKKTTDKALPAEKPAVQFVFVPENSVTKALGWPAAATGVLGLAVGARKTQLVFAGVNGGRVLVDDVDLAAVLQEAGQNGMNTPQARLRQDLAKLWTLEQQAYGIRVSEFTAKQAAERAKAKESQGQGDTSNNAPAAAQAAE